MTYFADNQQFALGIDLSQFNASADLKHKPNFDHIAVHDPRVSFIALRTGQSWGEKDKAFDLFFAEARRINACILPYHVIFPGEAAIRQVDNFLRILEGVDLERVRLVLDMELDHRQSRATITNTLLACLDLLRQETGRYPIIYSRASWVDSHLQVEDLPWLDWWLAQYRYRLPVPAYTPEHPCPPRLPRGVTQWLIHQTTERGPAIGGGSMYLDYDRWNGNDADVQAYFGRASGTAELICPLDGSQCCRESVVWSAEASALEVEA